MNPSALLSSTTANCPVCNTTVSTYDEQRKLCCGHTYHKTCLDTHLEKKNFRCSAYLCDRIITLHLKKEEHNHLVPTCRSTIPLYLMRHDLSKRGVGSPEKRVAFYQKALEQFLVALPQPLVDAVLKKIYSSKEIYFFIKNTDQNLETLHTDVFEKLLDCVVNDDPTAE